MGRPRNTNREIQYFGEHRYVDYDGRGYFSRKVGRSTVYMHREVWEHYHGTIRAGFEVHHRDHNRGNNDIRNLAVLPYSRHHKLHAGENYTGSPVREWMEGDKRAEALRRAAEWHASPEGLEWHRENGKRVMADRPMETHACTRCGAKYQVKQHAKKRGFCSPACQAAERRDSGVDNEQRQCSVCGGGFTVNRYAKTTTCCKVCANEALRRTRAARRAGL